MTETRRFRLLYVAIMFAVLAASSAVAHAQETRRYYALVIGNNEYKSAPRLKTAENDARAVEAILRESYGFRTKLLLNATRQQIISALNAYRRELDAESSLLVYYAGHGVNDKEIDKAYWLPVDAERDDNTNWISADDITSNIKGVPAKHVLIVSDSCYSGTLTRGLETVSSVPAIRERYLQKMAAGRSRTLMASGGNEPVADGGGVGNHSVFASALVRGLSQTEKTEFTAAELYREYVEEAVAGRASQTPEYNPLRNSGHESGDFVFVRVKTPDGKTVEVTVKTPSPAALDPAAIELSFWETIRNSTDPEDYRAYLDKYPNGQFTAIAKKRAGLQPAPKPAGNNSRLEGELTVTTISVYFKVGAADLEPETRQKLDDVMRAVLASPSYTIEITSFTSGSTSSDGKLAQRRADAVIRYLSEKHKIPLERLTSRAGAPSDNSTREGRANNRRVEIKVVAQ